MIADALMLNLCFLSGFVLKFLWNIFSNESLVNMGALLHLLLREYLFNAPVLTLICLTVFSLHGFYTYSRSYQSRYKALVIIEAVFLSYLIFCVLDYFFLLPVAPTRSILVISWITSVIVIFLSRLWSVIWKRIVTSQHAHGRYQESSYFLQPNKTILVIGGAGYIGSALLPKLLNAGYKVRLLDIFMFGEKPILPYLGHKNLEVFKADFRQMDKVVEAVRGAQEVIHLGAIVGDPACDLNENLTVEVNLLATKMIAEVCKGFGVRRFIFASTCSVYGASDCELNERSKLNPVSLYAKSKIASERVLMDLADDCFHPVLLRFGTVFGNSGRIRFDLVVNALTAKAYFDKQITVYGGDQWRPFVHVDDAAEGIMCALRAPLNVVSCEKFNVGDNALNRTIGEVGQLINEFIPDAELLEMGKDRDKRNYRVDFSKINRRLGFKAKWTLEAGIEQVLGAMMTGEVENWDCPEFSNAAVLKINIDTQILSRYIEGARDLLYG
ncbi:MAG: NAD-dependent dehydratase [Gammaproteobacteria bacterium GWE2_42_36]|nr:MAG: NAD-dependent dehydratase [Gammaproteobacteria bacterium GWE2_42_36]